MITANSKLLCTNCYDLADKCVCGDRKFTEDNKAVCPYCSHIHEASDSEGYLYDAGIEEYECINCEETFKVGAYCTWTYTTSRKK